MHLKAAARPLFFPKNSNNDTEKSRVSNSVVSQCTELLANAAADSSADAGLGTTRSDSALGLMDLSSVELAGAP
jgi:hypothetical protein